MPVRPETDVLMLPGTGFPHGGDPILQGFFDALDPERFRCVQVPYAAVYGGTGAPYVDSQQSGRVALMTALRESTASRVVIGGYSQGAVIAGDLADDFSRGAPGEVDVRPLIMGVALIADAKRPAGGGLKYRTSGIPTLHAAPYYGIAGARPISWPGVPVWWASVDDDPITALPAGNPLRTVADLSRWYSIRTPIDIVTWGARTLADVSAGRVQDWWAPWKWQGWAGATRYADNYLFGERHTTAYLNQGHCATLARAISETLV